MISTAMNTTNRILNLLSSSFLLLALVPACVADPPQRPAALDPSNPRAPESPRTELVAMSSPSPMPASAPEKAPSTKPDSTTVYTCPMHPEVRQPGPGRCPKCGMELVPAAKGEPHEHGGSR